MTQQFRIDSESIRDKLNNLLPSQNRGSIGVDLSGSTTIVPIVDLTETAEGSNLRQDLQTSISLTSANTFNFNNSSQTLINTTGYYRVFGNNTFTNASQIGIQLTDGTTTKNVLVQNGVSGATFNLPFDFIVFLPAGDSLTAFSSNSSAQCVGLSRQIADINGNLINP